MTRTLLLTGAALRPGGYELGEGKYYGSARLLALDLDSGECHPLLRVDEGTGNFPAEHPNLEFTVGCGEPGILWLAMDTEIRRYGYPSLQLEATYSHPCFHNIHSVAVRGGQLYVTTTGLDMVAVLDKADGRLVELLQTEDKPVWHRFSPDVDYRQMHSTRPHHSHPNHVFWLGDEPWVTRCTQEDAVPLLRPGRSVDLSGPKRPISVHDGVVHDGQVLFTLVDGTVVVVDADDPWAPVRHVDLPSFPGYGGLRGWCRGLHVGIDGLLYVGFSRLRQTRHQNKLAWVRRALGHEPPIECCSVLAVDLSAGRIVRDYRLPLPALDALYGILQPPGAFAARSIEENR